MARIKKEDNDDYDDYIEESEYEKLFLVRAAGRYHLEVYQEILLGFLPELYGSDLEPYNLLPPWKNIKGLKPGVVPSYTLQNTVIAVGQFKGVGSKSPNAYEGFIKGKTKTDGSPTGIESIIAETGVFVTPLAVKENGVVRRARIDEMRSATYMEIRDARRGVHNLITNQPSPST